ncbi:calcium-transporting ATPase [Aureococcus anophagefferens]|nr:calcium-transporting ATPase [Aureococcus anophagefferens]
MSVLVDAGGANALYVKGATESVLDRCAFLRLGDGRPPLAAARRQLDAEAARLSGGALRVLALAEKRSGLGALATYGTKKATKKDAAAPKLLEGVEGYAAVESGLTFVGLVGLRDPPRPEVPGAIEACGRAGVRVIVITGDNKLTAEAVCAADQKAFLGGSGGRVFSRAEPTHKQDIVRLLKEQGDVVAMTGDGVNDAPALKLADIGIAMGITGTEVAKEASDMAFIRYMISSNVGEVASIFLTAALGFPEGLIPVQLLWVNLVTDGPPATALGFNPPDADNMVLPPRRADDALLTPWILVRYFVVGAYVGVATVGVFAVWFTRTSFLGIDLSRDGHSTVTLGQLATWGDCEAWDGFDVATSYATLTGEVSFDTPCDYFAPARSRRRLSLSVLVSIEMFNALNALSEDCSLVSQPPWVNPYLLAAMALSFGLHFLVMYVPALAAVFHVVPLDGREWLLVLAFSVAVVAIDEVLKFVGREFVNKAAKQKRD